MIHPLEGIRVLDASQAWSGPYATMMLGDLGAEIIKVEPPIVGDQVRQLTSAECKGESPHFLCVNRNKKSITIDLKHKQGKALFLQLAEKSDLLIENYRPGAMKKLGLDYDAIKERNPAIIYCSLSGFGQDGPASHWLAYDMIIQAVGGAVSVTGESGGRPVKPGIPQGDIMGGMIAGFSLLGALFHKEKTGQGSYLDIAMLDAQISGMSFHLLNYLLTGHIARPMGNAHPTVTPYQDFKTRTTDIFVGILTEKQWQNFCKIAELDDMADDPKFNSVSDRNKHREELLDLIGKRLKEKPAEEWQTLFSENHVPFAPVNDVAAIATDPQVLHRNMLTDIRHPVLGDIKITGMPWKVPGVVKPVCPPQLGEHTEEILKDVLGMDDDRIEQYKKSGAV